jgi:hypothetical protein
LDTEQYGRVLNAAPWKNVFVVKKLCKLVFFAVIKANYNYCKGNPVPGGITEPPCSWGI